LDESLGFLVHRADLALMRTLLARFGPRGVTVEQWMVLSRLSEGDGITQRELARRNAHDPTTLARTLQKMERNGLVERHDHHEDGRAIRVMLTEKGRRLQAELAVLALEGVPQVTAGMTARDVRELKRLLRLVFENLVPQRHAASTPQSDPRGDRHEG
jgi:DNA-binding MarR family transcriptional regulator